MSQDISATYLATVANLDFEYELAHGSGFRTPKKLVPLCRRWQHILRLLPGCRQARPLDIELLDEVGPREVGEVERLQAWGVTLRVKKLVQDLGLGQDSPCPDLVRTVNDKGYSHDLEHELGVALPYSRKLGSVDEVREAVRACPHHWVIKHPFGVSGRERVVGKRGLLSDSNLGWSRRTLNQGWKLVFEPWVEDRTDFSLHWEISADGKARWLGWCLLEPDPGGVYRGNRVHPSEPLEPSLKTMGEQVVARLSGLGYRGPVSLDALCGQLSEEQIVRPLVEINARVTFGRLTLELANWVPAGWSYLWWHPKPSQTLSFKQPPPPLEAQERAGVYRLPELADPLGQSQTLVITAETPEKLQELVTSA